MIRLMVGLGNPGAEYDGTRHNAGFWWVDAAAQTLGGRLAHDRAYHGLVARINRPAGPVWLLQPLTFMNLSGKAVAPLARFFKIEPAQILVVHDELDLPPGQVKMKLGGSAAGHNGLKDITAQLGTPDFWRLRIGIGHPGARDEVIHWVLRKPAPDQRQAIHEAIAKSMEALPLLLDGTMDKALAALHAKPPRPKPPREPRPVAAPTGAPASGTPPAHAPTLATPPVPGADAA